MTTKQIYLVAGIAAAGVIGYALYQKYKAPAVSTTTTAPVVGSSTPSSGTPTNSTAQTISAASDALDSIGNLFG